MELTETIDSLNRQLVDLFGIDTISTKPMFRIVWSEDQFEKRLTDCTKEGLTLLHPQVMDLPKYRQWIKEKYVLERLVLVPEINKEDLPSEKLSYEPLWVFEDRRGNYLPPKLEAAKLVIDTVYAAMGRGKLAKYSDPDNEMEQAIENKKKRIDGIVHDLFGDETVISDALTRKEAIIVP